MAKFKKGQGGNPKGRGLAARGLRAALVACCSSGRSTSSRRVPIAASHAVGADDARSDKERRFGRCRPR
jgi:hypothetical protein